MTHEQLVARTLARYRARNGGKPNADKEVQAIHFALAEAHRAQTSFVLDQDWTSGTDPMEAP